MSDVFVMDDGKERGKEKPEGKQRPRRTRRPVLSRSTATSRVKAGYAFFKAKEVTLAEFRKTQAKGLSSQSCAATLHLTPKNGTKSVVCGQTGKGCGHAEMAALTKFVMSHAPDKREKSLMDVAVEVSCPTKPVCYNCACILGLLKAKAKPGTVKTLERMGSTQWQVTPVLKKAIAHAVHPKTEEYGSRIVLFNQISNVT